MPSKSNMIWKGLAVIPVLLAEEVQGDRATIRGTTIVGPLALEDSCLTYNMSPIEKKNKTELNSYPTPKDCFDRFLDCDEDHDLWLGPAVPEDEAEDATTSNFMKCKTQLPPSLDNEIVIDLPVGFFRLRRAFLSSTSSFWTRSILQETLKYTEVNCTGWLHPHERYIGHVAIPSHVRKECFIGAKRITSYRMPAGRVVPANMAYETCTLTDYTNEYFVLNMTTSTPGVPFGNSFLAKTQMVVVRTGKNKCRMICSVEADFVKGAPLGMKGQIVMGMKRGTMEIFEKIASFICQCANL